MYIAAGYLMRMLKAILPAVLCMGLVAACVSPAPALRDDGTATISGRDTAGLSTPDAERQVLLEAASITVDHGYQYFQILDPRGYGALPRIRPGADVSIKVVADGGAGRSGLWDAKKILTAGPAVVSTGSAAPAGATPAPYRAQPAAQGLGQPHCTAYGCEW